MHIEGTTYCGTTTLFPAWDRVGNTTVTSFGAYHLCFITGVTFILPFVWLLGSMTLAGVSIVIYKLLRWVRQRQREESMEPEAQEGLLSAAATTPVVAQPSFMISDIRSVTLLLAMCVCLCQAAQGVTLETFRWYEVTSLLTCFLGLLLSIILYHQIPAETNPWFLVAMVVTWSVALPGSWFHLSWFVRHDKISTPLFSFVLAIVYFLTMAMLLFCDVLALVRGIQRWVRKHSKQSSSQVVQTQQESIQHCSSSETAKQPHANWDFWLHDPVDQTQLLEIITPSDRSLAATATTAPHPSPILLQDENDVDLISRTLYSWISPLLTFVAQATDALTIDKLGKLHYSQTSGYQAKRIHQRWDGWHKSTSSAPSHFWGLFFSIFFINGNAIFWCSLFRELADLLTFVGPLALKGIIQYATKLQNGTYETPTEATLLACLSNGWVLAFLLFVSPSLQAIISNTSFHISLKMEMNVSAAIRTILYHKTLRLAVNSGDEQYNHGKIINHMTIDSAQIADFFSNIHYFWSVPLQVGITLYSLFQELRWAALFSLAVFIILLPLQTFVSQKIALWEKLNLQQNDLRLKKVNELLQGIKIVKLYAWEPFFLRHISDTRNQQLQCVWYMRIWGAAMTCIAVSTPTFITVAAFSMYPVVCSEPLTPDRAFSALSLFNILLTPMFILPSCITTLVNCYVSLKRLEKFLKLDNVDYSYINPTTSSSTLVSSATTEPAIVIQHGKFCFKRTAASAVAAAAVDQQSTTLESPWKTFEFSVVVPRGTLTMVVGSVGAGKSAFLLSILGEMDRMPGEQGEVNVNGNIAYCSQVAYILNDTLRENILFGKPLNEAFYHMIVDACELLPDLAILSAGDLTEIGEKGINLSGGQKARVSVARAVYSNAEILLLDDPLAALDTRVGNQVMEACIVDMVLKSGRTVVMTTHQLQYLKFAQQVIIIEDGKIKDRGTLSELQARGHELTAILSSVATDALQHHKVLSSYPSEISTSESTHTSTSMSEKNNLSLAKNEDDGQQHQFPTTDDGQLIKEEERETGIVKLDVYFYYFRSLGMLLFCIAVTLYCSSRGLNIAGSLWLSHWSTEMEKSTQTPATPSEHSASYYVFIYAGLCLGGVWMNLLYSAGFNNLVIQSANHLHNKMLDRVLRAHISFFDTTPVGRILNRFSSDISNIDGDLPDAVTSLIQVGVIVIASLLAQSGVNPLFAIAMIPVLFFYDSIQRFFRHSSRELQRLTSIARSPCLAHFAQTLSGLVTIRAYQACYRFGKTQATLVDRSTRTFFLLCSVQRWLGIRLGLLSGVIVGVSAGSCVFQARTIAPSMIGFCITYSLSVTWLVNWLIRCFAELEMKMNTIERVRYYSTEIMTEMPSLLPATVASGPHVVKDPEVAASTTATLPEHWPSEGSISFVRVSCQYRPSLPKVLKEVTFDICAGQHVAVCGRTGSGKSSLLLALFRMLWPDPDCNEGTIFIDGMDISTIPLLTLRDRLSIIPQDPVLFQGTARYNLSPTDERYSDEELLQALERAQLTSVIPTLDFPIADGGANLSVGQRQLFCLARACLKKNKIMLLDEATASIDQETDAIVQKLLRTEFSNRTILTIAHRITTIIDYDVILVLEDGQVVEAGSPTELLQRSKGKFRALVEAAASTETNTTSTATTTTTSPQKP